MFHRHGNGYWRLRMENLMALLAQNAKVNFGILKKDTSYSRVRENFMHGSIGGLVWQHASLPYKQVVRQAVTE
ncbi:MAG: hypothetical protein ABH886_08340 [Candidatus Desantisbacteria bacterium]